MQIEWRALEGSVIQIETGDADSGSANQQQGFASLPFAILSRGGVYPPVKRSGFCQSSLDERGGSRS